MSPATGKLKSGSIESANSRLAQSLVLPTWILIIAVFALPILGAIYLSFRNETLGGFPVLKPCGRFWIWQGKPF